MPLNNIRRIAAAAAFAVFAFVTAPAYAAGSNMPWEQPLNQILESVQGPVAKVVSVIIIVITGLTLAFGETSGGFRRLIQIVFGLSYRLRRVELLPHLLPVRRRGAGLMDQANYIPDSMRRSTGPSPSRSCSAARRGRWRSSTARSPRR